MQSQSHDFISRARKGLEDVDLQTALARFQTGFSVKRGRGGGEAPGV